MFEQQVYKPISNFSSKIFWMKVCVCSCIFFYIYKSCYIHISVAKVSKYSTFWGDSRIYLLNQVKCGFKNIKPTWDLLLSAVVVS